MTCQCRKGARCQACIERDGLTKAAPDRRRNGEDMSPISSAE